MISKKLDPTNRPAVDGPSLVLKAIMPAATEIQTASMSRDVASAGLRTCCVHARWTRTVNCVHQLVGYLAKRASRGAKRPARPRPISRELEGSGMTEKLFIIRPKLSISAEAIPAPNPPV